MESEKKRAPNFSASEKELLANIISEFKAIIEYKKTDALTWRDTDTAWGKIIDIFNSQNPEGVHRSKDSLRKSYDNLKRALRKDIADEKKELYETGGGLPESKILCKAGNTPHIFNYYKPQNNFWIGECL
ncbi:hypothetical protein JTB14_033270 [Gonioctena quinquepunctata]|nr:hypothetical protein JTB14_033270 [Gonioctena quinquepunctata]